MLMLTAGLPLPLLLRLLQLLLLDTKHLHPQFLQQLPCSPLGCRCQS
jgi:hypothetical protein